MTKDETIKVMAYQIEAMEGAEQVYVAQLKRLWAWADELFDAAQNTHRDGGRELHRLAISPPDTFDDERGAEWLLRHRFQALVRVLEKLDDEPAHRRRTRFGRSVTGATPAQGAADAANAAATCEPTA